MRDELLGHPSKDLDLEVFGLAAGDLKALLGQWGPVNTVGESFTVFKVQGLDVSLPRRESKVGRGHKGFEVHGDPTLPFDEAARRRDFTINAIGWDPLTGEYLDPHGGRADLTRRVLRMVDARTFGEDSLRVLRALQFAARFECRVDDDTRARLSRDAARRPSGRTRLGRSREAAAARARARRSACTSPAISTSSRGCGRRSRRWRRARRTPSGIPRATSGRTPAWSSTRPRREGRFLAIRSRSA